MTTAAKPTFDFWALVELFGHQRIAGHVTEQQIGGDSFVRVDVPDEKGETKFTRFFGAKAIYSINPMTREDCIALANAVDAAPVKAWEIPKQLESGRPSGTASHIDDNGDHDASYVTGGEDDDNDGP